MSGSVESETIVSSAAPAMEPAVSQSEHDEQNVTSEQNNARRPAAYSTVSVVDARSQSASSDDGSYCSRGTGTTATPVDRGTPQDFFLARAASFAKPATPLARYVADLQSLLREALLSEKVLLHQGNASRVWLQLESIKAENESLSPGAVDDAANDFRDNSEKFSSQALCVVKFDASHDEPDSATASAAGNFRRDETSLAGDLLVAQKFGGMEASVDRSGLLLPYRVSRENDEYGTLH